MDSPDFEAMTVEELVLWLEQQGIPRDFSKKFEGTSDVLKRLASRKLCIHVHKLNAQTGYFNWTHILRVRQKEPRPQLALCYICIHIL